MLVRVRAASVNLADWYLVTGLPCRTPWNRARRPESVRLGVDFAGTVEAVGANVTQCAPGDEVFGGGDGAFAEYVSVREAPSHPSRPD